MRIKKSFTEKSKKKVLYIYMSMYTFQINKNAIKQEGQGRR